MPLSTLHEVSGQYHDFYASLPRTKFIRALAVGVGEENVSQRMVKVAALSGKRGRKRG